jgi:hypothetical protein
MAQENAMTLLGVHVHAGVIMFPRPFSGKTVAQLSGCFSNGLAHFAYYIMPDPYYIGIHPPHPSDTEVYRNDSSSSSCRVVVATVCYK